MKQKRFSGKHRMQYDCCKTNIEMGLDDKREF